MRLIRLFKNDLAREVANWAEDGVINQNQAEQICQRLGVDYHQIHNRSFGYFVLIVLGYLFIGLALITLIGANWQDIPRPARMAGVLLLAVSTQLLGLRHYSQGNEKPALGIFFLGNLFFGAGIVLIAQIYHLGEHMADGVFWWALGSLPFALITRSPWLMLQSLTLAMIWFFMESFAGFYPTLMPLFIIPAVWILVRGNGNVLLLLTTVAVVGCWLEVSLARWWGSAYGLKFSEEILPISIGMFIFVFGFSQWLAHQTSAKAKDYGTVLSLWSLRFGLILMLIMTFKEPWRGLIRTAWPLWVDMVVINFGLAGGSLYLAWRANKIIPVAVLWAVFGLTLAAVMVVDNSQQAVLFQVIYNILLVAAGVWLIVLGVNEGISHYFFLGVAAILLTALMRYISLIGDYIGGAVMFMVFAGIMLGAAKYWRHAQLRIRQQVEAKEAL